MAAFIVTTRNVQTGETATTRVEDVTGEAQAVVTVSRSLKSQDLNTLGWRIVSTLPEAQEPTRYVSRYSPDTRAQARSIAQDRATRHNLDLNAILADADAMQAAEAFADLTPGLERQAAGARMMDLFSRHARA